MGVEHGSHLNGLALAVDAATAEGIASWFVTEASPGKSLTATIPSASRVLTSALTDRGFERGVDAPFNVDMRIRTADADLGAVNPSGYRVRALEEGEQEQLVECHRAAWNPHLLPWPQAHRPDLPVEAVSTFNKEAFAAVEATQPYRRDLVTVIEAADGSFAASCIAWLDETTGVAEVEPLGVVPAHRGRGLGRALILGAVAAIARTGGVEVTIHPRGDDGYPAARRLYGSCGFRAVGSTLELQRPREEAIASS